MTPAYFHISRIQQTSVDPLPRGRRIQPNDSKSLISESTLQVEDDGHQHSSEHLMAQFQTTLSTLYYMPVETSVGRLYVAFWGICGILKMLSFEDEQIFKDTFIRHFHVEPALECDPPQLLLRRIQDAVDLQCPFPGHCDFSYLTPLQVKVLTYVRSLPVGKVCTYGDVADAVSTPNDGDAIEQILLHNPFPMIIPCHRVIRNDGTLGGYVNGKAEVKQRLLSHEGIVLTK